MDSQHVITDGRTWYHIIATTYGAWLYGDVRGFRTRHHREHVDGDYRSPPPPGEYEALEKRSRDSLRQAPVALTPEWRQAVGASLRERLGGLGAEVICVAVAAQHVHVLAKIPTGKAREWMGVAKRHAWFELRRRGWTGKLWGKRSKAIPIGDRVRQLRVFRYVLRHAGQGAWVWACTDGR